jgi:predicted phosphohydrolase
MIYCTGDSHSDFHKFSTKFIEFEQNDIMIILGDFGGIWWSKEHVRINEENYWLNWLNKKPFTTIFVDGNHENFERLLNGEFPVVDYCGGKAHQIREKIFHLKRGEIFTIENKKFFVFGGAASTDKEYRIEGKSWWSEEEATFMEQKYALENLEKHGNKVDYILSHTAPKSIIEDYFHIYERIDGTARFLEEIKNTIQYQHWYHGHMHKNVNIDEKHTCLYQVIEKLE